MMVRKVNDGIFFSICIPVTRSSVYSSRALRFTLHYLNGNGFLLFIRGMISFLLHHLVNNACES